MPKVDYKELQRRVALVMCELFKLKEYVAGTVDFLNVTGKALDHYREQDLELEGFIFDIAVMEENIDKLAKKNSDFEKMYGIWIKDN